jgi:hypothetical protein
VAALCGHAEVVRLLLQHPGVDIDARDSEGRTPLYVAAMGGYEEIVEMMLQPPPFTTPAADSSSRPPAQVNLRTHAGLSAFFIACWRGHHSISLALLSAGADLLVRDREGRHAWAMAREWNHVELAEEMERRAREAGWSEEREPPLLTTEEVALGTCADVTIDFVSVEPAPSTAARLPPPSAASSNFPPPSSSLQPLPSPSPAAHPHMDHNSNSSSMASPQQATVMAH